MAEETEAMQATVEDWAGPQTHEEARCYHNGVLGGLTAYARERGDSTLKSENDLLRRLMDEAGFSTIEIFERLQAKADAWRAERHNETSPY